MNHDTGEDIYLTHIPTKLSCLEERILFYRFFLSHVSPGSRFSEKDSVVLT